jgi:hypothetical protein
MGCIIALEGFFDAKRHTKIDTWEGGNYPPCIRHEVHPPCIRQELQVDILALDGVLRCNFKEE